MENNLMTVVIIIIGIFFIYSTFVERKLLTVRKLILSDEEKSLEGIKIIHISDTQLGYYYNLKKLKKVVNKINELKPDIVVFTGDLIDRTNKNAKVKDIVNVLNLIDKDCFKLSVYGNHDRKDMNKERYKRIMDEGGFILLENEKKDLVIRNRKISIIGIDDVLVGCPDISKAVNDINSTDYNVILVHEPDYAEELKKYPIDLILSGHSHGGQIALPFIGPLVKNKMCKIYNKGLYNISEDKIKLIVNCGLGNTFLPFRLGNIPEIIEVSI